MFSGVIKRNQWHGMGEYSFFNQKSKSEITFYIVNHVNSWYGTLTFEKITGIISKTIEMVPERYTGFNWKTTCMKDTSQKRD